MGRLIIDNRSDLTDAEALAEVLWIVKDGRVSNQDKQYCYLTIINYEGKEYQISTDLNKKSDRFVIRNNGKLNQQGLFCL